MSGECVVYTEGGKWGWSGMSGRERCDRVSEALDELYAKVTEVRGRLSLDELREDMCIRMMPSGDELGIADGLCGLWGSLDEIEAILSPIEEMVASWDDGACRRVEN
jgi:hypothetical protein